MDWYFGDLWLVRLLFQRGLAVLYAIAFLSAFNQFPAILGERGLEPAPTFLKHTRFRDTPSLFHWKYSDALLRAVAMAGLGLSLITAAGLTERAPWWSAMLVWLVMYAFYLSIVNVGQTFYSFGWESMLLEAGFFSAFLGSRDVVPPVIVIVILRWMLFRTEFGAGMIKIRGDACWRDLTCLYYHYETQPLPNVVAWYFHRFPQWFQRQSVMFSHFVQLVAPWGLFAPQPFAAIAAAFLIIHQLLLIVSGNYSWLNWLTVVLGVTGLYWPQKSVVHGLQPVSFQIVVYAVGLFAAILSIKPAINLFSPRQFMNYCWNRFHLVCAYGAFGSVTKERYEIVIEGSDNGMEWTPYEFKAKPGDPRRRPPQVAPYHLRLDWLVWFLPFTVRVMGNRLLMSGYEMWFVRFILKLLEGDAATLKLMRRYPAKPPRFIHAAYYLYRFSERRKDEWWTRTYIADYLPPVTAESLRAAM